MVRPLLTILCLLAPLANLRLAEIEPMEIFLLAAIPFATMISLRKKRKLRVPRVLFRVGEWYLFFLLLIAIPAALAWRFHFYVPAGVSWLKLPPIISFVRIVQVALAVTMMIAVANAVWRYVWAADFLARTYVAVGVVSVLYGTISWLLLWHRGVAADQPGLDWFGAQTRWGVIHERGFFVEGGPFGVYVASVIVIALFRHFVLRRGTNMGFGLATGALLTGLLLSRSKAGVCMLAALGVWSLFASGDLRAHRKAAVLTLAIVLLAPIIYLNRTIKGLANYWKNYQQLELVLLAHPFSGSTVEGRLAALYVVPEMIKSHPIMGVGIGNYSVLRNSPAYSPEIPPALGWDEPGLGFFGYAAELGIPLLFYLMFVAWTPVRVARRRGERAELTLALCAFQFFAVLFGTPITFYYPYLASALALGHVLRN